jgi:hypothetical protein
MSPTRQLGDTMKTKEVIAKAKQVEEDQKKKRQNRV